MKTSGRHLLHNSDHLTRVKGWRRTFFPFRYPAVILFGFDTVLCFQGGCKSSRSVSGDMLSCWCWHSDKRSWLEPLMVYWNNVFGLCRSLLKVLQVQAMTAVWNVTSASTQPLRVQSFRTTNKKKILLADWILMHVFIAALSVCPLWM